MRVFLLGGFTAVSCFFAAVQTASATGSEITEKMVTDNYNKLEKALNDRSNYMQAIRLLDENISDDAHFRLSVTNTAEASKGASPVMEMGKQDYINTYIQGTHYVNDYHLDIQTVKFKYDPSSNKAETVDIMTESGKVPTQFNSGKPFVSRTTCTTRHELRDGAVKATASECHTDISFEEEI